MMLIINRKEILKIILFLILFSIVYTLWVIQPVSYDDWQDKREEFYIPEQGQNLRYAVSRSIFFSMPFSFFRLGSMVTALVSISLFWRVFLKERLIVRFGLTLLTVLGFPYLGVIGPWNLAGGDYGLAVVLLLVWYIVYRRVLYDNTNPWLYYPIFFIITFLISTWHEVYLVIFGVINMFFIFRLFAFQGNKEKLKCTWQIIIMSAAYILAVLYFTNGGIETFVEKRLNRPGMFQGLFAWPHIFQSFLGGTKENIVLLKDSLPLFLLFWYIKLDKRFQNSFESDWKLFAVASVGVLLFMYITYFFTGPIHWRARWLCMSILAATFYVLPKSFLVSLSQYFKFNAVLEYSRKFALVIAIGWFSFNAFFCYFYTNIDVVGWLYYRQMVIERNPLALQESCCDTLPKGRPRGSIPDYFDGIWGAHDSRYRYFFPPSFDTIKTVVRAYWNDMKPEKR